jgi:hypothetical protein
MEELEWFVSVLDDKFQVKVNQNQIGYEGTELYLEEIDQSLIPSELSINLPEALLFETMLFEDEEGTEWLGVIALHPETNDWCLQVIMKDGEVVLRQLLTKPH